MAHIVLAYIVLAYIVLAYIGMAYIAMAYTVMAHIVTAHIAMAYIVMVYVIMGLYSCGLYGYGLYSYCSKTHLRRLLRVVRDEQRQATERVRFFFVLDRAGRRRGILQEKKGWAPPLGALRRAAAVFFCMDKKTRWWSLFEAILSISMYAIVRGS